MPTVTINGRSVEVEAGTNLIEAAAKVGVQVPHYCYHPRLSVVGQCRMCLVEIEGMPKLQAGCSMQVMKDGMVVSTESPQVAEAQRGMMEFFLINHPLDCPICDQAGECGLQDYAFKHGQAFSRFGYEDKRTYPGRERIPLGPNVLLNMNRCIQCTRCIRFTHEVSGTGELAFMNRGARTEIGTFPGKPLDGHLATNVVDICPVGALTSTRFRFAERVWYLDKRPSLCTGCDVGCNITLEHKRGNIRRYKPRFNPEVNDYWMCDHGRASWERYHRLPRLAAPRRREHGALAPISWSNALDDLAARLGDAAGRAAIVASGNLTTEEAFVLARLGRAAGIDRLVQPRTSGPAWSIPNTKGGIVGGETVPNRRGVELAGFTAEDGGLAVGEGAEDLDLLIVADSDLAGADDEATVDRLRRAGFLVVLGWADTPLAAVADLVLPTGHHAETAGTFVNVEWRLQAFVQAFPPPGQVRPAVEVLADLLERFEEGWRGTTAGGAFDRLVDELPAFAGMSWETIPATGAPLAIERAASAAAVETEVPEGPIRS